MARLERPLHLYDALSRGWNPFVLGLRAEFFAMNFETILPILRKSPGSFAWREDPAWRGEAIKMFDGDLVNFELSDPDWHSLAQIGSEDILAEDWDISLADNPMLEYQADGGDEF